MAGEWLPDSDLFFLNSIAQEKEIAEVLKTWLF